MRPLGHPTRQPPPLPLPLLLLVVLPATSRSRIMLLAPLLVPLAVVGVVMWAVV
jgi:hypothetical protein